MITKLESLHITTNELFFKENENNECIVEDYIFIDINTTKETEISQIYDLLLHDKKKKVINSTNVTLTPLNKINEPTFIIKHNYIYGPMITINI